MPEQDVELNNKLKVIWSNSLILLPALIVSFMSLIALDTLGVRALAVVAILITVIFWCVVSYFNVPWKSTWKSMSASIILSLSVLLICLPVRIAAAISSAPLNRLADRVEAGEEVETPVWAGVFYIREVQNWNGMPCLWTFPGGSGSDGLARPYDGVAENKFNDWSTYRLHGNWFVIAED